MKNGKVPPVLSDLAERIESSGRTRREIAMDAGVTERQIYHVLRKDRNLSARLLTNIAGTLGYDVRLVKSK